MSEPSLSSVEPRHSMYGTWICVESYIHGEKWMRSEDSYEDFETGRCRWRIPKLQLVSNWFNFTLDTTLDPKHINIEFCPGKPKRGIYTINGDELVICLPENEDMERPTCFESTRANQWNLTKLQKCHEPNMD